METVDPETIPDPDDFPPPPEEGFGPSGPGIGVCTDDGSLIDVLIVYTQTVGNSWSQVPYQGAEFHVGKAIADLNEAFSQSQIPLFARLVGMSEVSYNEVDDSGILDSYNCLKNIDCLPLAHFLKRKFSADIVTLVILDVPGPFSGWGGVLEDYNVVEMSHFVTPATNDGFVHEMGHNLGAGHQTGQGNGADSYCHGFRQADGPSSEHFNTIMTVPPTLSIFGRVNRYSNPNLSFLGRPTGTVAADNTRCIRTWSVSSSRNTESDCNNNEVCDVNEIANGTLVDCDHDLRPDACYLNPERGGCCVNGTCSERTELCCLNLGGVYIPGDDCLTDWDNDQIPDACETPVGACCFSTQCYVLPRNTCNGSGGTFKGAGTRCGGNCNNNLTKDGCEVESFGACCKYGLFCEEMLESCCSSIGGVFGGKGTYCEDCDGDGLPAVCEVGSNLEFGACCDEANGKCTIRTACSCHQGTFMGAGTTCAAPWCNHPN